MPHETLVRIHSYRKREGLGLEVKQPQEPTAIDNTLLYAFSNQNYMLNKILLFYKLPSLQCAIIAQEYSLIQVKTTILDSLQSV